jgi:hypothetical protein
MMTVIETGTFDRTLQQRLDALGRANDVRVKRARFKEELASGRRPVSSALVAPPAELHTMKVADLLLSVPTVGPVKARKLLRAVAISPSRTVAGLSERQRRELLSVLGVRAGQT